MTSFKPRHAISWSGAVDRIVGHLGIAACAAAAGRSESIVRKWGDPDTPELPSVEFAFRLDLAWSRAGFGGAPFLEVWRARLGEGGAAIGESVSPFERLAHVTDELGALSAAVIEALRDAKLSASERATIAVQAQRGIEQLNRLIRDMEASQ